MSQDNQPTMAIYGRHAFICTNGNCTDPEQALAIQRQFLKLNQTNALNKLRNPERVKCTLSDCLGVCSHGPILTIYPDGIWYHGVDETALVEIYREHILGGRPVEKYIFHRLYPAGQEPRYAPGIRGDAGTWSDPQQVSDQTGETQSLPTDTPTAEEVRARVRRAKKKKGLVIVNTGNGKGKTTAALGVMTRAWGRKMRVGVMQFLKNENARYGEIKAAERMGSIDWISTGDGWTWTSQDMDETEAKARHGWEIAKERIAGGQYDLFIMDEFTYPLHFGWLDTQEVIDWLRANKPAMLHLIVTGRSAPPALIDFADLVTEMQELKHPFKTQGIRAQAGIEY